MKIKWVQSLLILLLALSSNAWCKDEDSEPDDANEEIVRMDGAEASRILALKLPEGAAKKTEMDYLVLRQQAAFVAGAGRTSIVAVARYHQPELRREWRSCPNPLVCLADPQE